MSNNNRPFQQQQYYGNRHPQSNQNNQQTFNPAPYGMPPVNMNNYHQAQYYSGMPPHPQFGHSVLPPWEYYPYPMNHPPQMPNYSYPQPSAPRTAQKHQTPRRQTPKKQLVEDQEENDQGYSSHSSQYESEEQEVYYKKKPIAKKKDPVLDSKEQIRKWIEARKRNYPRRNRQVEPSDLRKEKTSQEEISLLEKKIRKKLVLINGDSKSIIKKQKDLDILRKFILYPRRPKRNLPMKYERQVDKPLVEQIVQKVQEIQKPPESCQKTKKFEEKGENIEQDDQKSIEAVQVPIESISPQKPKQTQEKEQNVQRGRREPLSVDVIIKHLQMRQEEDSKTLQNFMDYKSNSFQYRYQYQTLQTNLLLDNVFRDTSYMLQAIRYIVKNNFFD